MTAIAYRDGVLAGDQGVWRGVAMVGLMTKVHRLADGRLLGMSGQHGNSDWWKAWFEAGAAPAAYQAPNPDAGFSAILVGLDGRARLYQAGYFCGDVTAEWLAIGAVTDFLHGALAAGATAEQAVRLAIQHTDGAAGGVDVLRVEARKPEPAAEDWTIGQPVHHPRYGAGIFVPEPTGVRNFVFAVHFPAHGTISFKEPELKELTRLVPSLPCDTESAA